MSNVFQTYLKGFKLKILVVEPKMTQPVKPAEEPVKGCKKKKKHFLSSRTAVQPVKVEPQPIDPHLNWSKLNGHLPSIKC